MTKPNTKQTKTTLKTKVKNAVTKLRKTLPHEAVCRRVFKMNDAQCNAFWATYATISWCMIPFHWILAVGCGAYNLGVAQVRKAANNG